jgi:predicted nucleotidyltransferase
MLNPAFKPFLPQIITLFEQHKVVNANVLGSILTDHFNNNSDVDILVNIEEGLNPVKAGEQLLTLYVKLRDLLNKEIDLIKERSLKPHI